MTRPDGSRGPHAFRGSGRRARIVSTGSHLPGEPIDNEALLELVGPLDDEVLSALGVRSRHWVADRVTGEHRERNSEMAYGAARQALERAGLASDAVDLIVTSTGTPDQLLPPMVSLLQEQLGLATCTTLEVRSGGAGTAQALDIARLFIERGTHSTALVVGSEVISPVLVPMYLGKEPESIRMRDRVPLYMFGDGAGAILLQGSDEGGGILGAASASIGGKRKPGVRTIGGGTDQPIERQRLAPRLIDLRVDIVEARAVTPQMIVEAMGAGLRESGLAAEEVALCLIPGGAAEWIEEELGESEPEASPWRALRGRIYDPIAETGAAGSATLPVFLDRAWSAGRIEPGDRIMLVGLEATNWTYATVVVEWTAQPATSG